MRPPVQLVAAGLILLPQLAWADVSASATLHMDGDTWSGPAVAYPQGAYTTVEADLRRDRDDRPAVFLFRQRDSWLEVRSRDPRGGIEVLRGRAALVGPSVPTRGDRWTITLEQARLEIRFSRVTATPPATPGGRPANSVGGRPLPSPPSPRPSDDDEGYGCEGDPVDDPEPWTSDDEGTGCGGDSVGDDGSDADDGSAWGDDEGAGCGGDGFEGPTDDNGEFDDSASCEGDDLGESDDLARSLRRSVRFGWPFVLVLGLNRGARRRRLTG